MLRPLDGAGNEEAQANMLAMDKNLDRVSALLHGLGSLAQVRICREMSEICTYTLCRQEMGQQLDMQRSKVSTVAEKVDRNAEKQSIIMGNAVSLSPSGHNCNLVTCVNAEKLGKVSK